MKYSCGTVVGKSKKQERYLRALVREQLGADVSHARPDYRLSTYNRVGLGHDVHLQEDGEEAAAPSQPRQQVHVRIEPHYFAHILSSVCLLALCHTRSRNVVHTELLCTRIS